jgi:MSHA pilin protein MshD
MCTRGAPARCSRGMTLMELVVAIVIVGVGLAGVLGVLNAVVQKSADPFPVKQALAVAEGMIEEVALKNYANPPGGWSGTSTQANRKYFDDIGDYVTTVPYDTSPGGVYTVDGAASLPGLSSYTVKVEVFNTTLNAVAAKRIKVTVTDPSGQSYSLSTYRTNY